MADLFRSAPDSTPLRATYRETIASPGPARHWLEGLLATEGLDPQTLDEATLVVSELVTNALIHGGGAPNLRMTLTSDAVMIAVADEADIGEVDEMRPGVGFPSEVGGLGLFVVERLALSWGVVPRHHGKTVWAILPRR